MTLNFARQYRRVLPMLGHLGWAGVYLMLHGNGPLDGRRVLFVTSDTSLLALRPEHDAVAALLRDPHECSAPREDVPREG